MAGAASHKLGVCRAGTGAVKAPALKPSAKRAAARQDLRAAALSPKGVRPEATVPDVSHVRSQPHRGSSFSLLPSSITRPTATTSFLAGQNVLLEKVGAVGSRAMYTQLPGIWGGAFPYRRGADHYYLLPDFQGHTRQLTNAAGAIFEPHIYDAWGREIWPIVTTGLYLRGFGQLGYWRGTASREYVRARHLRVELGRWLSMDPMVMHGSSRHEYAGAGPFDYIDPPGMLHATPALKPGWHVGNNPPSTGPWQPQPFCKHMATARYCCCCPETGKLVENQSRTAASPAFGGFAAL